MSNRLLALCRAHHFPFFNRSDDGVTRVYDQTCNVIETHAHVAISANSKVRTTATARPSAFVSSEGGMNSLSVEEILGFEV